MNQTPRLPFPQLVPATFQAFIDASTTMRQASIGTALLELVFLRVSQINGCAYCVDKHWLELLSQGEDTQRMNSLSTWREVDFFNPREQAALAWAESLTNIAASHASDEEFDAVRAEFSDREVAEISFAVALMAAWNRMAISMRQPVERKPGMTSTLR